MAKQGTVDWNAIKTEYLTTKCGYRQLSAKYDVSIGTISKVAAREHWSEQREQIALNVQRKAIKKVETQEVNRLARLIAATTKAIDVAMEAFEDEQQFNRYVVEHKEKYSAPVEVEEGVYVDERQWTEEKQFAKIDSKALKDLTGVLKDLTGLMRDFYNIPTPAQAESQRIAAERLELERKKSEADRPDSTIEVVLSADLEDLAR